MARYVQYTPIMEQFDTDSTVTDAAAVRRDRILRAAGTVFAAEPYREATIEKIAVIAGISVGTVYLSFTSKEDVYVSAVQAGHLADGQLFAAGYNLRLFL